MDDADLMYNFKKFRRRYWIRSGLWIPEDTICKFTEIETGPQDNFPLLAECIGKFNKILITPELAYIYCAAHTALLHEMAHLYIGTSTNWNRNFEGHGKTFNAEIDRLYALGAFQKLI